MNKVTEGVQGRESAGADEPYGPFTLLQDIFSPSCGFVENILAPLADLTQQSANTKKGTFNSDNSREEPFAVADIHGAHQLFRVDITPKIIPPPHPKLQGAM